MAIFVTADLHLFHGNIIDYCNRPFDRVASMHAAIAERWNKVVTSPNDLVYCVGDTAIRNPKAALELLQSLNGILYLLPGDHDAIHEYMTAAMPFKVRLVPYIVSIRPTELHGEDYGGSIVLCHYPIRRWAKSHYGSWHLFGHVHGGMNQINTGKSFDVGVDSHNFTPWSMAEVAAKMKTLPENENRLKGDRHAKR